MQVRGLLGLQQLGVNRLGRHHKTQAQAGCQHLGERAHVDAAFRVAGRQRRGWRVVKPQVAVGVVFHQRQIQFSGSLHQGGATCFAHGAARGVLEVGQHVQKARSVGTRAHLGLQVVDEHAFVIAGHGHHSRLHGREGLQRAQVGGRFHQHAAVGVDQHLGDQVQRLLRASGDEHLVGIHIPGQEVRDGLAQRAIPFAGGVLQGGGAVIGQHGGRGFGKGRDREGLGRGQAARQADDAGLFRDLEDFADDRRVHALGAARQGPGAGLWKVVQFHSRSPAGGPQRVPHVAKSSSEKISPR
ncbi:hypothetical protein D3C71_1349840 [compost metagenome]